LQARAANRLVLQQYTNQLLGPLINVAVLSFIKNKLQCDEPQLNEETHFFSTYFKEEFVLIRAFKKDDVLALESVDRKISDILSLLFQPYVESFYIILHIISRVN